MRMKRIIALLAAIAMLVPAVGCSENTADGSEPSQGSVTDSVVNGGNTEAAEETEAERFEADIPAGTDYGGAKFNILAYPETGNVWIDVDFHAEEQTGEILNDAVYTRTLMTEDLLNVDITRTTSAGADGTELRTSVQASDGAYQVGFVNMKAAFNLAEQDMLLDMNTMNDFQINAPWWDQNAVKDLSILNRNYMLTGDISILYRKSLRVLYYNKMLAGNYQVESPYEKVSERTWTFDAFDAMCRQVTEDLDGNGLMDQNDRYGIVYSSGTGMILMVASGVRFADKDENDVPFISFYSEKTVEVWEKYTSLLFDEQVAANGTANSWDYDAMFRADQGLFACMELHHVEPLREMDSDFGILPMPLFDEAQENFYVTPNTNVAGCLVIPVTNVGFTMTSHVLDVLGAESKNTLTPAYYEVYLKGKSARDEESRESLDIIFNSVRYDIGTTYDWGSMASLPHEMIVAKATDLASRWKRMEKPVQKLMEKTLKGFEDTAE